ncbi:hypothetical protein NEOLEDRAFT_1243086 [Neolentinus lepideus HHB14362 ss-1]|uniref:Uncharacterized protein n=1 Tax=Neolentinus lepideus HHB14362 ss-1 TaxID=1314782 RepID=A0A165RF26_9AGAM|nr:hypothetical protein NEOLEDRAFT_1243086 [Neolentinus lepideus HHB14362 ss-1]
MTSSDVILSKRITGTQSPPLEATGEDKPMGASSVKQASLGEGVDAVPDSEQRGSYFKDSNKEQTQKQAHGVQPKEK